MDHDVLSANDFAGEVCIGLQQVIAGMGSSALLPLSLPIVNYDAPPITSTGTSVCVRCVACVHVALHGVYCLVVSLL